MILPSSLLLLSWVKMFFFLHRFGLSNKFESEFPSALTGKVSVWQIPSLTYIHTCSQRDWQNWQDSHLNASQAHVEWGWRLTRYFLHYLTSNYQKLQKICRLCSILCIFYIFIAWKEITWHSFSLALSFAAENTSNKSSAFILDLTFLQCRTDLIW